MYRFHPSVGAILLLVASNLALASGPSHWEYAGEKGPDHWGDLSPEFTACSTGKNQSPINLSGPIKADLPAIQFDYKTKATEVTNNGHTIQTNFAPGSTITLAGRSYELKQVHFHVPSENLIDGKSFPMEGHLVHADKDGNLAVVAVMYTEGAKNPALVNIWRQMPEHANEKVAMQSELSAADLLPAKRDYYRFSGSLTTPPCSEGVDWLVLKTPVNAGHEQVERFSHIMHHPNNRPVQPVFARTILK